jgi:hypothetical protein
MIWFQPLIPCNKCLYAKVELAWMFSFTKLCMVNITTKHAWGQILLNGYIFDKKHAIFHENVTILKKIAFINMTTIIFISQQFVVRKLSFFLWMYFVVMLHVQVRLIRYNKKVFKSFHFSTLSSLVVKVMKGTSYHYQQQLYASFVTLVALKFF